MYEVQGVELATPLRRLGGYFLDCILYVLVCGTASSFAESPNEMLVSIGALIFFGYFIVLIVFMAKSTSPGKKILGMRVYKKNEVKPVGFWRMFARETLGKFISLILLGFGFLWILIDQDNQGWHDKLINSVVLIQLDQPG